jgi:hypothetical protein
MRGGGVIAIYKNSLTVNSIDINSSFNGINYDMLCFDLYLDVLTIRFIVVYLPPDQAQSVIVMRDFCKTLKSLLIYDKPVIMTGDFNLPQIDWATPSCSGSSDSAPHIFYDFYSTHCLTQCVDYSTHDKDKTLDLLICNDSAKSLLLDHFSSAPPWHSDHYLISAKIMSDKDNRNASNFCSYPDFKTCDYSLISDILYQSDWSFCFSQHTTIQHAYDKFISVINSVIAQHVPIRRRRNRSFARSQPKHIRGLLRQKKMLYKKIKTDRSSSKAAYKSISKKYDAAVKQWNNNFESNLCKNPNSKKFYNFINSKLKSSQVIPPLKNSSDDRLVFNDLEKANLFNLSFQKFFTRDDNSSYPDNSPLHKMSPFTILPADVLKACKKMKNKISRTPEGIPSYFIVKVIHSILYPLTFLFNLSLKLNYSFSMEKRFGNPYI